MAKFKAKNSTPNEAFSELCHLASMHKLTVEIEKPFKEFEELFLRVLDENGEEVNRITLNDISALEKESSKLLNKMLKSCE